MDQFSALPPLGIVFEARAQPDQLPELTRAIPQAAMAALEVEAPPCLPPPLIAPVILPRPLFSRADDLLPHSKLT